jgi:penicillin G amidase
LNVGRVNLKADAGQQYTTDHGPSLRALYDLADPKRSRIMISTGQSGLPWSRHYRDLLPLWTQVSYLPLWSAEHSDTLTLSPP